MIFEKLKRYLFALRNSQKYENIICLGYNCEIAYRFYKKYKFNNTVRQRIRKDLKIENNIVIGNVGRLHFQKNQSFLIDIFSMLSKIHDNLKLILVGEGEDHEKLENKVKELNLDDKVLFLGAINNVDEILQAFDLFVFPSLFEGLPVTLIEAQISGLKVFVGEKRINSKANINNNKYYVINPSEDRQKWVNIISENLYQYERDNIDIDLIKKSGYDIKEETKKIINLF